MATAMLFSYRIEMAHDWNELALAIEESEGDVEEARESRGAAVEAQRRGMTPEEEIVGEAAAVVEREHGLLTLWIARFMAEYHRFCASLKNEPQQLISPPIPDTVDALQRMIEPRQQDGPWQRPAGGGGRNGERAEPPTDGAVGDGSNGGGPTGDRGGPNGGGPGPRPEPPPAPDAADPRQDRRSDQRGRPRRFGGGG
jgi:hypothetical protein